MSTETPNLEMLDANMEKYAGTSPSKPVTRDLPVPKIVIESLEKNKKNDFQTTRENL